MDGKEISKADLQKLYNYAVKIDRIGKKYGLKSMTKIYTTAYSQLKK